MECSIQLNALRVVGRYAANWTEPPKNTDTQMFSDAPMIGNGDVGVVIGGTPDSLRFYLGKSEFISLSEGAQKAMSRLILSFPQMEGASYHARQMISSGKVRMTFQKGTRVLALTSWIQATDTTSNLLFIRMWMAGEGELEAAVTFQPGRENKAPAILFNEKDLLIQDVSADEAESVDGEETVKVRCAARLVGGQSVCENHELAFTLRPKDEVTLVVSMMSNLDSADYKTQAVKNAEKMTPGKVDVFDVAHENWWWDFWSKSFVEIPNKTIEKQFYFSLYYLASCMRKGEYAPGLYGGWVLKNPAWAGIAPINYNYQAPYYCLVPTNHLDLADSYEQQILDWIPQAKKNAEAHGFQGLYFEAYPRRSMFSARRWTGLDNLNRDCFMCQKSNGILAATHMILRYYHTRDLEYARLIYPEFLKGLGEFWVDDLKWDGTRYVIENDYVHEGPVNILPQTNPLTSLGCLRLLFQALIDISQALGVDLELRPVWQERLEKLSRFPTFTRNGRTVFRNQESGTSAAWSRECGYDEDFSVWSSCCAIPEMALMYPGSQIGLFSDPELLTVARETVAQQARWTDDNMTCFFYPSAARVGHDPAEILEQMTHMIQTKTNTNLTYTFGGGGIENFNTVPATLVEMLCQYFQGKVKLFANWPKNMPAKFGNLLIYGNFLVSSQLLNNQVQYIGILSNRGEILKLVNPWPDREVVCYRNGEEAEILSGEEFDLPTGKGERICLAPKGVTYWEIKSRMR